MQLWLVGLNNAGLGSFSLSHPVHYCLSLLYFQYGMGLAPCIICVYQRFALCGIIIAGLIGSFGYQSVFGRWLGYVSWIVGAGWGLKIAHDQVVNEQVVASGGFFYLCLIPRDFLRGCLLNEWIPAVFHPTGMCGEILWTFLGYSMPFWMRIVFAVYLLVAIIILASQLKKHKYNPYD
ncbi:MAG: disulfide bond formation protein B [Rheinheimera sp.]|nr:disulfide bond formation protein B [Rheinheimera sp.]